MLVKSKCELLKSLIFKKYLTETKVCTRNELKHAIQEKIYSFDQTK